MTTQDQASHGSLPPPLALYQMSIGHYVSRALNLAAKLGVADLIHGGARRVEALADATGTHAPSLRRMLRLLVSVGVFAEDDGGELSLTPLGEALRGDAPMSMRDAVMLFAGVGIQDSWRELEHCVRTGQPAFTLEAGADAFTFLERDPEHGAVFDRAMATFTAQIAVTVAAAYDFSAFATVMDVGGGNGALLIGILAAHPHLQGIVFDLPRTTGRAREKIAEAGLKERCRAVGGDFFEEVPRGADAYMLKHVIHDWNDDKATAILRQVHAAMPPAGRLLIVEGLYPERVDGSLEARGAAANDVNMLVCTGGRQRSEAEFRSLFRSAGFELTRIVPTMARVAVIEGSLR